MRIVAAALTLALLSGCATTRPGEDRLAAQDPLEGFNRGVWAFNTAADTVLVRPTTTVYRTVTPRPARRGLSRLLANLSEPFSAVNNVLQGKPGRAGRNIERFLVNSTIGVGGLADHASEFGIEPAEEDFGQTLGAWGANGGPYLVLPLLGPSTMRDAVGSGVGMLANPYRVAIRESDVSNAVKYGETGAEIIIIRSDLMDSGADAFLKTSLDPYAAARSAYLQRRRAQIRDLENDPTGSAVDELSSDPQPDDVSTGDAAEPATNN